MVPPYKNLLAMIIAVIVRDSQIRQKGMFILDSNYRNSVNTSLKKEEMQF